MSDGHEAMPALVPARMLNEFTYCPRLFHLEWVQQQWADNADTAEGTWQHRAVDVERGRFDGPDADDPVREARSVSLSSERLGLTAKLDIVEGGDGWVVPVDVKKGRPPPHGPAWEPELVQVCAAGLLLREAGYRCREGVIYYSSTRHRETVEFTEELVTRTLGLLADLRSAAIRPEPPEPLVASPKCPRCSLVGICLPDEVNTLAERSQLPVRRMVPSVPSSTPVYVAEQGAYAGVRAGRLTITRDRETLGEARLIDVSQLAVFGNVSVSAQLMRELFTREVPVCWFSYGGWFQGIAEGLPSRNVELRRRQYAVGSVSGLPIARAIVEGKIRNCRTILRRNGRADEMAAIVVQLKEAADHASEAGSVASLLGVEGAAVRLYFQAFPVLLRRSDVGAFDFEGRNRRPPNDRVNCLMSFAYSLLVKDMTAVLMAVGFDPYFGVYHQPRFGRPALALDLIEEFRPLVGDSVVVGMISNAEIAATDFVVRAGGVALTSEGRKKAIAAYERRMAVEIVHPVFKYKITYRRVFEVQARLLGAVLLGEVAGYRPFTTR